MDDESLCSSGGGSAGVTAGIKSNVSQDAPPDQLVLFRIYVPELNVEKCLQFHKEELIWEVKQQVLTSLPKELQESFNYGLFLPPSNGKAGKFLDEERLLSEYPMAEPIGYLELKYKRRVYKMLQMDEKQLKSINSKASHKKFLENVGSNNVDKINKMCVKGLDPNFHCENTGETPLCLASGLKTKPARMLITLVNGGAIVDFRTRDGTTAVHKAVVKNNAESVRTLLDLGASPNYKDSKGLSPLYLAVSHSADVTLTEMLLHDHAIVGAQDLQGWQEVHQACRNGLVSHLEHLIFYSADMNSQNASGNTPLHVCAVNNQESCVRTLLFRGADKEALNYAGQTAYQVAVIAGNLELAEVIKGHRSEDIVPFRGTPKFNPRRRMSVLERSASSVTNVSSVAGGSQFSGNSRIVKGPNSSITSSPANSSTTSNHSSLSAATNTTCIGSINGSAGGGASVFSSPHSQNQHGLLHPHHVQHHQLNCSPASSNHLGAAVFNPQGQLHRKPPSPSPSDRSLPPFSSSGSSMSETSTGSSATAHHSCNTNGNQSSADATSSAISVPGQGPGIIASNHNHIIGPACIQTGVNHGPQQLIEDEQLDSASALAVAMTNDPHNMEVLSLSSSGVGTTSGSQSGSAGSSAITPTGEVSSVSTGRHQSPSQRSLIIPGMHVVCIENYISNPREERGLSISQGEIIEVIGSTNTGILEGSARGKSGLFPAKCVQEVRLRNPESLRATAVSSSSPYMQPSVASNGEPPSTTRVPGRRETREQQQSQQNQHFATAVRHKDKIIPGELRNAILHKGKRGFGFVLRGAKAASPLMEMIPSHKCPGLQYMDDVDPGGVADMAGIFKGDFLLEINGEDVRQASHEIVVNRIRKSGDLVSLTVVTILPHMFFNNNASGGDNSLACSINESPLPSVMSMPIAAGAPSNIPGKYSTLPRKLHGSGKLQSQPPPPPKRDPNTTLSVGKARAKSMVANLAAIEALDKAISEHDFSTNNILTESVDSTQRTLAFGETSRPPFGDLIDLNSFDRSKNKVYASVAEMKRSKIQYNSKPKSNESYAVSNINGGNIHKEFSSTPDLKKNNIYSTSSSSFASQNSEFYTKQTQGVSNENVSNVSRFNAENTNKSSTHNSNILNSDFISDHLTDTKLHLNGVDSRVGHQRGYYTLPSRHKKVFEEGGSYRAVTRIRPVIKGQPDTKNGTVKRNQTVSDNLAISPSSVPPAPPPPPEHPPPPPPITQVMKLDGKSDYAKVFSSATATTDQHGQQQPISNTTEGLKQATNVESIVSPGGTVRSSFKPTDNAKLYASPQTVQQLAYRSPVSTNKALFENLNSTDAKPRGSPVKKRSPTSRANSMPPRPSRPQVLRRSSTTDMPLQSSSSTSNASATAANSETYNINGVNYTTYTTFRSPITPDECDVPGSLSSRTFVGIDPDLTPTASEPERFQLNEGHPVIPEPDYDMSDSDYGGSSSNGNNYYCGSDVYNNSYRSNSAREGMGSNGTTLERKKKKTVSFVINEEVAAKLQAGRTTRQDSILKDPSREREREKERIEKERLEREREELFSTSKQKRQIMSNSMTVDEPSPFALGEKYADPIVKIPMAKLKNGENCTIIGDINNPQHSQQTYQLYGIDIEGKGIPKTVIRVGETDKIRIEVPPEVPLKSALSRSNSAVGNTSNNISQKHQLLQKSRSFCADKSILSVPGENSTSNPKMNPVVIQSNPTTMPSVNTVSSKNNVSSGITDISANEILRVRSQLKSSRSFTNEFPKKSTSSPNRNNQLHGTIKTNVNDNLGTDINHEEAENSSSGVSSDQEQNVNTSSTNSSLKSSSVSAAKFVTYLPVDGGSASTLEVGKGLANCNTYVPSNSSLSGRGFSDTSNVSSLQPNHQSGIDNVSESGSDDVSSEKSWVLRAEQDNLGRNIIYMKKMLHPKLQAIFDKPSNGVNNGNAPGSSSSSTNSSSPTPQSSSKSNLVQSTGNSLITPSQNLRTSSQKMNSSSISSSNYGYSSQTLPHKHQYPNYLVQQQYSQQSRQTNPNTCSSHLNKSGNDERSISQSLALINQHVNSLGEVNVLAGINGKGQCEPGNVETSGAVLAPPPGFSDGEPHQDGSHRALRNVNQPGKKVTFIKNASDFSTEQFKDSKGIEAPMNSLMTRSMGPTYDGYGKPQQVFNSDVMSQSIIDFNTTNNSSRIGQYSFSGGKGMKNESKLASSSSSIASYATLPKKQHFNTASQKSQSHFSYGLQNSNQQHQKEFRTKSLIGWSTTDVCDWLDSLFMPEYKPAFLQNDVDGFKLASITKSELESLGVIRVGHMLNIEKSLKRYLTA